MIHKLTIEQRKHGKILIKEKNKFLNKRNVKGTVENINRLIKRFFPKGTDFDTISKEEIAYVED